MKNRHWMALQKPDIPVSLLPLQLSLLFHSNLLQYLPHKLPDGRQCGQQKSLLKSYPYLQPMLKHHIPHTEFPPVQKDPESFHLLQTYHAEPEKPHQSESLPHHFPLLSRFLSFHDPVRSRLSPYPLPRNHLELNRYLPQKAICPLS